MSSSPSHAITGASFALAALASLMASSRGAVDAGHQAGDGVAVPPVLAAGVKVGGGCLLVAES